MPCLSKSEIHAIFAVLLWSTVATSFKWTLNFVTPLSLLTISSLSSLIVLLFFRLRGKKGETSRERRPYLFYVLLGILNPFLYYTLLFEAYQRLFAQEALILNYTWPIALGILSSFILKKKLERSGILGLIIGFIGVIIVATRGNLKALLFPSPEGIAFALLSAWVWGLFWSLALLDRRAPQEKLFFSFLFGTPLVLVRFLLAGPPLTIPLKGFLGAVYIGLFEMSITFMLWLSALSSARKISLVLNLAYLIPFLSMGFISLILKEKISPASILGLLFVLVGIYLTRRR